MRQLPWSFLIHFITSMFLSMNVAATFSIIAIDKETGACGFAVATNNLAVGSSVGFASFGQGVIVSQFETNPIYAPLALKHLKAGKTAKDVLALLLNNDGNFEGRGIEARQVALIDYSGQVAQHTGKSVHESAWAGSTQGANYAIQGNGLVSKQVLLAMEQAFLKAPGELAFRLMSALMAGSSAGGQRTGLMSAAIVVKTHIGWPVDIDFRVDGAQHPVQKLRELLNFNQARQIIISAERMARKGKLGRARVLIDEALQLGNNWDRIWRRAARLSMIMDDRKRTLKYLDRFVQLNQAWATYELEDELYAPLLHDANFLMLKKKITNIGLHD